MLYSTGSPSYSHTILPIVDIDLSNTSRSGSYLPGRDRASEKVGYSNGVFGSWGDYDRKQFQQDSHFHKVPFPIAYPHINLKQLFSEIQGLPKRYGMAQSLEMAGLILEGTHHRGIDDARNIAKLLPYILGTGQLSRRGN